MRPSTIPITDIWFRSPLTLDSLVEAIGLLESELDAENYWEWAIGWLDGMRLDITCTHTAPAASVDTRIFCCDVESFTPRLTTFIVEKLLQADCGPVTCGRWVYRNDNDYDLQVIERFPRSA